MIQSENYKDYSQFANQISLSSTCQSQQIPLPLVQNHLTQSQKIAFYQKQKQSEQQALQFKLEQLRDQNAKIESENEKLSNQYEDLSDLLQRVNQEGSELYDVQRNINYLNKNRLTSLQKSLKTAHECSQHFSNVSNFWESIIIGDSSDEEDLLSLQKKHSKKSQKQN